MGDNTLHLPELPASLGGLGISWFREQDWPRWLAIDPDFQPSYEHWLRRTEAMIKQYEAEGKVIEKIPMDPASFEAWRRATNHGVGTQARAAYVAMQLMLRRSAN